MGWTEIFEDMDVEDIPFEKFRVLLYNAKKDKYFIGYCETRPANSDIGILYWYDWQTDSLINPTHWQPLPNTPQP